MPFLFRNLNTRARSVCFAREHRELPEQPIDARFAQQVVGILQRQILGNVAASRQPALRSASDNAAAHASSSSLIFARRWYHERRIVPPQSQMRNISTMTRLHRALMRLLTVIPAVGLFFLISANPFAQSNQLPAPSSHLSDFAGVIDCRHQDAAGGPSPGPQGKEQDRSLRRCRRKHRRPGN